VRPFHLQVYFSFFLSRLLGWCLFAFNLSLLRQRQHVQETRISPFSQPLQYHSHPQSTLSHTTPSSSRSLSVTLSTPAHTSLTGKLAGPANSHVGNNKKKHKPPPPTPPVRALQGLTFKIRDIMGSHPRIASFLFSRLLILTEHQFSTEFRPDEIVKSRWDFHAVSGTVTTSTRISRTAVQRWTSTSHP